MEGEYPRFKSSYLQEELAEAFQLGPDEFDFVFRYRSDHNRHGIAIWLKSLLHLGYFPETLGDVPESVRLFLGKPLGLLWDHSDDYRENGRHSGLSFGPRSALLPDGDFQQRRTSRI